MVTKPDDLMKMQAQALDVSGEAAAKTLEGFRKLAALNLQMTQAALDQSADQVKALLAARDAKTLSELVTSFAQPSPEKFTAYAKAVYAISSETSGELTSMIEKQVAASNRQLADAIETMARSAPGGADGAMAFMKQAMSAATNAYEQVSSATKSFVDQTGKKGGKR